MTKSKALGWLIAMAVFPVLAGGLISISGLAHAQSSPAPGPEVCATCHADAVKALAVTKHGTKADRRTPESAGGCASCHGDATAHVKAGGGKNVGGMLGLNTKSVPAETINKTCLSCHQGDPSRLHWQTSVHANRDVACTSCHQVHTANDKVRDKLTQPQVCFTCHKEQRAQINRPSRHPIPEGKMTCSDCHNTHGSAGAKNLVRDNVNDTCYTCHMEKRGPFVRTHQPVQESCSICHNPHGTTAPNMLNARSPFLCQQCHEPTSHRGGIGTLTGTSTGASTLARGCLNCHTQIHGTNNPANISNERTFRR